MHTLWTALFYQPLYNILVLMVGSIAFGSLPLAIIFLTVLVKLLLWPLTKRSIIGQIKMKSLEPEISSIKEKYTKEEQAKKTFELYKKNGVNPFSSCLLILIQMPIIIALYYVFWKGFGTTELIYGFVTMPTLVNTSIFGLFDVTESSAIFAALAGLSQFAQLTLSPTRAKKTNEAPKNIQEAVSKNMQNQMRFVLPVIIAVVSIKLPVAVALYWITSNIVTIIQERTLRSHKSDPVIVVS